MKTITKNPAREKALDKVRKMMALANDPNASEGEIENALKFSQNLMAKFEIENDEVDLSPDDIDIEIAENDFTLLERKYWFWDLLSVIGESNDCQIIRSKKYDSNRKEVSFYKIIGTRNDRLLTKELFDMTVPVIRNLASKRFADRKKEIKLNPLEGVLNPLPTKRFFVASYIDGFVIGLGLKLQKNKEEIKKEDSTGKYGLMVIKKDELVSSFIKAAMGPLKMGKSTSASSRDINAFHAGVTDGKEDSSKRLG